MWNTSRGLRATVVRGLAKVGLVWALAVLGAVFVVTSAHAVSFPVPTGEAPRTAGLALALVVLAAGTSVLGLGAARGHREPEPERRFSSEPHPAADLP